MIILRLTRDQARLIEKNFLPYMIMLAKSKAASVSTGSIKHLRYKIILSLIHDVQLLFKRKLLTTALKLKFNLSDAHGVAFYIFLMRQPISDKEIFAQVLRQQICNHLYQQLIEPVKSKEEEEYQF